MPALAETQGAFRRAIANQTGPAGVTLVAPRDPLERLAIYRRHFRESFRRHLRGRYPTVEWLVGTPVMTDLADTTLRLHPPTAPSLAEYGAALIDVVAEASVSRLPAYVTDIARLDWHLGRLAVELAHPARTIADLAQLDPNLLLDVRLALQPGLAYLGSSWPVDELIHLRLSGNAPERFELAAQPVWLELRGARETFALQRLTEAECGFRHRLATGEPLGTAAEAAMGLDPAFDLSVALARLFSEGLVTAIHPPHGAAQ